MIIQYLPSNYVLPQLRMGMTVEQWLGHTDAEGYRTIKFLQIYRTREEFSVAVLELFDEGNPEFLDLYSFAPVDPDLDSGIVTNFPSPDAALDYANGACGATPDKFVMEGVLQTIYALF